MIAVTGRGPRWGDLTEGRLRQSPYLQPRRSKHKISPVTVAIVQPKIGIPGEVKHVLLIGPDGKPRLLPRRQAVKVLAAPEGITFYFPRQVDGQPVIGPDEKKVRFIWELKGRKVKTDFDLRKMVREGQPDL